MKIKISYEIHSNLINLYLHSNIFLQIDKSNAKHLLKYKVQLVLSTLLCVN